MITAIKPWVYSVIEELLLRIADLVVGKDKSENLVRLGSKYGGWWIPERLIEKQTEDQICLSIGLGLDISFDQEMLKSGYYLVGVEPIEEYCNLAIKQLHPSDKTLILNQAVSAKNKPIFMSPPKNIDHASWTIKLEQQEYPGDRVVESYDLKTTISHIKQFIAEPKIMIVKMDIEGSEIEVLQEIIESSLHFPWLCFELDSFALTSLRSPSRKIGTLVTAVSLMKSLKKIGYEFVHRDAANYHYRRNSN